VIFHSTVKKYYFALKTFTNAENGAYDQNKMPVNIVVPEWNKFGRK
jgi:hypothetical protein